MEEHPPHRSGRKTARPHATDSAHTPAAQRRECPARCRGRSSWPGCRTPDGPTAAPPRSAPCRPPLSAPATAHPAPTQTSTAFASSAAPAPPTAACPAATAASGTPGRAPGAGCRIAVAAAARRGRDAQTPPAAAIPLHRPRRRAPPDRGPPDGRAWRCANATRRPSCPADASPQKEDGHPNPVARWRGRRQRTSAVPAAPLRRPSPPATRTPAARRRRWRRRRR
eukprot:ctg_3237.g390